VVHAQALHEHEANASNERVTWHFGDLTRTGAAEELLSQVQPDEIYNLVAVSVPALSWEAPYQTTLVNALIPQRICEWVVKHRPSCRLFNASSSEIFGNSESELQNEETPIDPKSPYGITKAFALQMMRVYREKHGVFLSSGILFNHESPRRPLRFVSQKIAHAVAAISLGLNDTEELDERGRPLVRGRKLFLGNLNARRDFGYAGDIVKAMHLLLQSKDPEDFVIGTGQTHSIGEFCETAFAVVNLDWTKYVSVDDSLVRPFDIRSTRADPTRLMARTGWRPQVSFEQLVEMMVLDRIKAIQEKLN
jgi:GDPmannose 4,6-dehydratase